MARTLIEARAKIYSMLHDMREAGRPGKIDAVDFYLCEDDKTVMIYSDIDGEQDALAIYFDLQPGEMFNPHRYSRDFFRPMAVN